MKLSIITVNLNNRDGLKRTIDSVVHQTFNDYEWIVIDGGSTDGSKELIESYASYFSYSVSEQDRGIYNAMNKGVSKAKGEYIQFLNSGDWLVSCSTLADIFQKKFTSDILYGNFQRYSNNEYFDSCYYPSKISLFYLLGHPLGHNSCFFKRTLFDTFLYNENYKIVSDWEFCIKCAYHNSTFEYLNLEIGCFDMNGISSTNTELLNKENQIILEYYCPNLLQYDFENYLSIQPLLANMEVGRFIQLRKKHRIIGKFVTFFCLILKSLK